MDEYNQDEQDPRYRCTHTGEYCMIAPDEETLFESNNDIVGSGS